MGYQNFAKCEVRSVKLFKFSVVLSSTVTDQKRLQFINAPPSSSTDSGQSSV